MIKCYGRVGEDTGEHTKCSAAATHYECTYMDCGCFELWVAVCEEHRTDDVDYFQHCLTCRGHIDGCGVECGECYCVAREGRRKGDTGPKDQLIGWTSCRTDWGRE